MYIHMYGVRYELGKYYYNKLNSFKVKICV